MYLRECTLEKPLGRWKQQKTALLPEELAQVGLVLSSRIQREIWDNGWKVLTVGNLVAVDAMDPTVLCWKKTE